MGQRDGYVEPEDPRESKVANGVEFSRVQLRNIAGIESSQVSTSVPLNSQNRIRVNLSTMRRGKPEAASCRRNQPRSTVTQAAAPEAVPDWRNWSSKWRLRGPTWLSTSAVNTALPTAARAVVITKIAEGVKSAEAHAPTTRACRTATRRRAARPPTCTSRAKPRRAHRLPERVGRRRARRAARPPTRRSRARPRGGAGAQARAELERRL